MISPDDDRVAAGFQHAEAEQKFWEKHRDELSQKYPDQFVAVVDGAVIATATDLQQLLYALRTKSVDPPMAWVRFMASRPRQMIL